MSFRVYYRAWNTDGQGYEAGDAANHSVTVVVAGSDVAGLTPQEVGAGLYYVDLTDVQLPKGSRFAARGTSSTENVVLVGFSEGVRPANQDVLTGAHILTATVQDDSSGDPIEGARVRVTTNSATQVRETDANGQAQFSVNDGTHDVAITHPIYSFTPTTVTISGSNKSETYQMTAVVVPSPSAPGDTIQQVIAVGKAVDSKGDELADLDVMLWPVRVDRDGNLIEGEPWTVTSDASGDINTTVVAEATYKMKVMPDGLPLTFDVPAADDIDGDFFVLPGVVGRSDS